jgi:hypothetical protein
VFTFVILQAPTPSLSKEYIYLGQRVIATQVP